LYYFRRLVCGFDNLFGMFLKSVFTAADTTDIGKYLLANILIRSKTRKIKKEVFWAHKFHIFFSK